MEKPGKIDDLSKIQGDGARVHTLIAVRFRYHKITSNN